MAGNRSCLWSSLPSELLHLISTKLPDLSDRVRLRAVCKSWHSFISILDPSPRLPWVMCLDAEGNQEIGCYSLSSKKFYKIYSPQLTDKIFHGTACGFIISCLEGCSQSFFLFNPLTRLEISLPSPENFKIHKIAPNPLQEDFIAFLESTQQSTDETIIGLIRPGGETNVIHMSDMTYCWDMCVYYKSMYYVGDGANTRIIDATTGEVVSTIPSPEKSSHQLSHQYMLESCGEILIVYRHKCTGLLKTIGFDIYRLDEVRGKYQWVKVRDIGDRMLFLDNISIFSLRGSDFPGFKGNCTYFMLCEECDNLPSGGVLLCRHDLENGTTTALPNFWGEDGFWIIPNFG